MAYFTDYYITPYVDSYVDNEKIETDLRNISGYDIKMCEYHKCSWSNFIDDMIELSLRYPEVRFNVEGEGEDTWDIWEAWFENGKHYVEKAIQQIFEYDKTKMV